MMLLGNSVDRPISTSASGREICTALREVVNRDCSSYTFGEPRKIAMAELCKAYNEASAPNWDGDGAVAITSETFIAACRFLNSIPTSLKAPEISPSATGDMSFDWIRGPKRIVSVGVSGDGIIHFASIYGASRLSGSMPITGAFDAQLRGLIERLS